MAEGEGVADLTDRERSLANKRYTCQHLCVHECDFKDSSGNARPYGTRRLFDVRDLEELEFYEACDCHPESLDNALIALREHDWASVARISFRASPHARQLLDAMRQNPYNFPSLVELDVCKTDVIAKDLDDLVAYLCGNALFVRNYPRVSSHAYRGHTDAIFISIRNGTTYSDAFWPIADNEFMPSCMLKADAFVVYRDTPIQVRVGPMSLRVVGGYKPVLS